MKRYDIMKDIKRAFSSLKMKNSFDSNVIAWVECAGQCSLPFHLTKVRSVQQMCHLKPILIVEEMVQSSVEAACVMSELWEGLITSQCFVCCHSLSLKIVVLVSAFNLINNRIHQP